MTLLGSSKFSTLALETSEVSYLNKLKTYSPIVYKGLMPENIKNLHLDIDRYILLSKIDKLEQQITKMINLTSLSLNFTLESNLKI